MDEEWKDLINGFLIWMAGSNVSRETLRVRRSYLSRLAAHHPDGIATVTVDSLSLWMSNPLWQGEARKSARATARGFLGWACMKGHVSTNEALQLRPVRVPRAKPRPTPDAVFEEALRAADQRERCMMLLGARGGLRRGEISRVRGDDLDENNVLRIVGKGGHVRLVPVHDLELIDALRAAGAGWLFPGNIDGHISADWTGVLLSRLLGRGWTGHTLRHRCGTRAYAGTHNLRAVQELLGHASINTTQLYTAITSDDLHAAVMAAA